MRFALIVVVAFAAVACAENRQKRQAQQQQYYPAQAQQAQTQSPRYSQAQYQAQQPASQYQQGQQYSQYDYQQQAQAQPARRPAARQAAAPARKAAAQTSQEEEEEEEVKPSPLELLLERSNFKCDGKKDGYYADTSVECRAFHYCIGGAKNSFMCAEGTVFHQVHLNCVPADQDICGSSEKYYFVNDYLNKELEQRGPNNTILYADRYYPEGFVVGDPIPPPPQSAPAPRVPAFAQQYEEEPAPRQRPAARPAQRQAAPAGVTYRQAAQAPAQANYRQAAPAAQATPAYRQPAATGATYRQPAAQAAQPAQAYDPYAQYRGGQQATAGQNPYYRSTAASNPQAQYQYEDQSSEERGVKYDDE